MCATSPFDRSRLVIFWGLPPPGEMPSNVPSSEGTTMSPLRPHVPPDPNLQASHGVVSMVLSEMVSFFTADAVVNPNCWLSGDQKKVIAPSVPRIGSAD